MIIPSDERRPAAGGYEAAKTSGGVDSTVAVQVPSPHVIPLGYIVGIDGKRYPRRPLTDGDRLGLIAHVHDLACGQGLSIRQVIGALETQHGIRRSVGSISSYLNEWTCSHCSGAASQQSGGAA